MATFIAAIAITWMMWYRLLAVFMVRRRWNGKPAGRNAPDEQARKKRLLLLSGVLAIFGTPAIFLGFAWVVQTYLA